MGLVGLEAPFHESREAAWRNRLPLGQIERREGERGRAGQIARHEEPARRRGGHSLGMGPQNGEIVLECLARPRCEHLVGRACGVERFQRFVPSSRCSGPVALAACLDGLPGPLGIAGVEKREVEQPFAGIIHDIQGERARPRAPAGFALVFHIHPQLADAIGGLRPAAALGQRRHMLFIRKARHRVVRLVR